MKEAKFVYFENIGLKKILCESCWLEDCKRNNFPNEEYWRA